MEKIRRLAVIQDESLQEKLAAEIHRVLTEVIHQHAETLVRLFLLGSEPTEGTPAVEDSVKLLARVGRLIGDKSEAADVSQDLDAKIGRVVDALLTQHSTAIAKAMLETSAAVPMALDDDTPIVLLKCLEANDAEGFLKELERLCELKGIKWKGSGSYVLKAFIVAYGTDNPRVAAVQFGNMGYYYIDYWAGLFKKLNLGISLEKAATQKQIWEMKVGVAPEQRSDEN